MLHQFGVSSLLEPEALIRRCDDLPATITHVPVAAVLVLNTLDNGRLRTKHVECLCRNKICTVSHQVGVSFDLYYDARKHKIKIERESLGNKRNSEREGKNKWKERNSRKSGKVK